MAYSKDDLYKKAKKAIQSKKLLFVEDVIAYLPCSKSTFYTFYPDGSDELNDIKEAIEKNRINTKVSLRNKWKDSDNATLQIALYKTICSDDERRKLNTSYSEVTGKDGISLFADRPLDRDELSKRIKEIDETL